MESKLHEGIALLQALQQSPYAFVTMLLEQPDAQLRATLQLAQMVLGFRVDEPQGARSSLKALKPKAGRPKAYQKGTSPQVLEVAQDRAPETVTNEQFRDALPHLKESQVSAAIQNLVRSGSLQRSSPGRYGIGPGKSKRKKAVKRAANGQVKAALLELFENAGTPLSSKDIRHTLKGQFTGIQIAASLNYMKQQNMIDMPERGLYCLPRGEAVTDQE